MGKKFNDEEFLIQELADFHELFNYLVSKVWFYGVGNNTSIPSIDYHKLNRASMKKRKFSWKTYLYADYFVGFGQPGTNGMVFTFIIVVNLLIN